MDLGQSAVLYHPHISNDLSSTTDYINHSIQKKMREPFKDISTTGRFNVSQEYRGRRGGRGIKTEKTKTARHTTQIWGFIIIPP